jgi:hypothetical protein
MLSHTLSGLIDVARAKSFLIRSASMATAEPPQATAFVTMATALSALAVVSPLPITTTPAFAEFRKLPIAMAFASDTLIRRLMQCRY